jgi:hypothetical protein
MPEDVREEVFQAVKTGVFTPFLGAGASSLRSVRLDCNRYPWEHVAQTLAAIRRKVPSQRSKNYLRSFARQRLRMSDRDLERYLPLDGKPDLSRDLEGSLLVNVQVELVRATVRLTNYLGTHLANETPSLHALENCCVPFVASELEGQDAVVALVRAADIAEDANARCAADCESPFRLDESRELGIDRVYEKLVQIIKVLTANENEMFAEVLERHREALEDAKPKGTGELRLDVLQWLSDLLWYTLTYWLPCYPTTAELAFELSLNVIDAPARRADLAQAAQALETVNLADLSGRIKERMDYCENGQDQRKEEYTSPAVFYDAIAAALQHQFEHFSAPLLDGGEKWEQSEPEPAPLPIVFTTNFDRAMERAFEKNGIAFHVLFPVIKAGAGKVGGRLPVVWKLRSWRSQKDAKEIGQAFEDEYWEKVCPQGMSPNIPWAGPLIVKLHGSPSEKKGKSKDQHWIVLSEVGYLQALEGSGMPDWVREQLRDSRDLGDPTLDGSRSLWFLGYSIADWNVRLRLYQDSKVGGARRTFNREADPYRRALLKILGIEQSVGDLNEFPRFIRRALKDKEIVTSPEVDELVQKLTSPRH